MERATSPRGNQRLHAARNSSPKTVRFEKQSNGTSSSSASVSSTHHSYSSHSPPTKPFTRKTLHTYTPNATPVPYRHKPPAYLHTLLPHILPPLISLYPDPQNPPKTEISLHMYALVSQYGDKMGMQKSEKDLMWYDVLCCLEQADDTGTQNEFSIISAAFNGPEPMEVRNRTFMEWAIQYMRQYDAQTRRSMPMQSPPRRNQSPQKISSRQHASPSRGRMGVVSPLRTRGAASADSGVPDLLKDDDVTSNTRSSKTPRRLRTDQSSTQSAPRNQRTHSASPPLQRPEQQKSTVRSSTIVDSEFPLEDYAKQISDRVLQKKLDREYQRRRMQQKAQAHNNNKNPLPPSYASSALSLNPDTDDQFSTDSASQYDSDPNDDDYSDSLTQQVPTPPQDQDLKSRRNINVTPLYVAEQPAQSLTRQPARISVDYASSRAPAPRASAIPSGDSASQSGARTPTSASTPLSSSSFVRLFTQQQQKLTGSPVAAHHRNDTAAGDLISQSPHSQTSPDKSLILESYLKASGDDILETASSFIDKFYDDIVSPVSKERSVLSRKGSSSSILSQSSIRRRDMFKDSEIPQPLDFGQLQSTVRGDTPTSVTASVDSLSPSSVNNKEPDSKIRSFGSSHAADPSTHEQSPPLSKSSSPPADEAAMTPTNTALTDTLSPLPSNSESAPKTPTSPQSEVSHTTYEHMVHEYWTNYKSIMKTAKWKAEVIDLIAETRAEYELERRHAMARTT